MLQTDTGTVCRAGLELGPNPSNNEPNCSLQPQSRAQTNTQAAWATWNFEFSQDNIQDHLSVIINKFHLLSTKNIFCTLMNIEAGGEVLHCSRWSPKTITFCLDMLRRSCKSKAFQNYDRRGMQYAHLYGNWKRAFYP